MLCEGVDEGAGIGSWDGWLVVGLVGGCVL